MRKMQKRVCSAVLIGALLFGLCGCNRTAPVENNAVKQLKTNSTETAFTSLPAMPRGFGTRAVANAKAVEDAELFRYTGEPLSFGFVIEHEDDGKMLADVGEQLGIRLFLNGVPQPFTVAQAEGVPACPQEVEEYYFDARRDTDYTLPITFTPVCGHTGDCLALFVVITPSPNYRPEYEECDKGNWCHSASTGCYPVNFEAEAPTQQTVDALQIETGVTDITEANFYLLRPTVVNPTREARTAEWMDLMNENGDIDAYNQKMEEAGYIVGAYAFPLEEGNRLRIDLCGGDMCTPLYRLMMRLDGEFAPVFEGKYYADARLPNNNGESGVVLSLDLDFTEFTDAHALQLMLIPLVPGMKQRTAQGRLIRVCTTPVVWISTPEG